MKPKPTAYPVLVTGIGALLEQSRRAVARSVNCLMTATYWEVGRRIVEFEQGGKRRAEYGEELLKRLAKDLTARHGRGFSKRNLEIMRRFYECWPIAQTLSAQFGSPRIFQSPSEKSLGEIGPGILQTPSAKSSPSKILSTPSRESSAGPIAQTMSAQSLMPIRQTPSGKSATALRKFSPTDWLLFLETLAQRFPLPWSHYVRLLAVKDVKARGYYEEEALRGGWSVRQLNRQIGTLFYERTLLSKNKTAMLKKGAKPKPGDAPTAEEALRDPLVLEFLNLKDEYSETDLEDALIRHLESFLLELGGDFAFVGRQRRLRIGNVWYRVDLIFFHRRLRCLVVVDLKLNELTHADAGQMHLYLNYAGEHWTHPGENPPVGLILCSSADAALVRYTLDSLPNKVMAREYQLALPAVKKLEAELRKTRARLERAGTRRQEAPSRRSSK
jgi:predicted nuclease of restriction endonuclease-like (RecB) superfamily